MGRWTTTTTYTEIVTHKASYHFTCPKCRSITPEIPLIYEVSYQPSVILSGYRNQAQLTEQDAEAIKQTAMNRLRTRLINDYISAEKQEYQFIKAKCPKCGAVWQWKSKKKLFSKKPQEVVANEYQPKIDWQFNAFAIGFSDEIKQVKEKYPGLFSLEGFWRLQYTDAQNASACFEFIVPGLRSIFLNDLMGNDHPFEAFPYQVVKPQDAPALDSGEKGYGYFDGEKTRWAIVRNGIVVRKAE